MRSIMLRVAALAAVGFSGAAGADPQVVMAPPGAEFVRAAAGPRSGGYVPSPTGSEFLSPAAGFPAAAPEALPSSYDLRTLSRVTPVKDQGTCPSCWAFATYGALESWLKTSEGTEHDFSENNLKNTHGFDLLHNQGGNPEMAAAYLSRWSGPVAEADDPYSENSGVSPAGLPARRHVYSAVYLPVSAGAGDTAYQAVMKQTIVAFGAVATSMRYQDTYLKAGNTYYCTAVWSDTYAHGVTLAGWDDAKTVPGAPGAGAWIVRNSYGTDWGDAGYFYVSYYDTCLGTRHNTIYPDARKTGTTVYRYDPLGYCGGAGYASPGNYTLWGANVFTASETQWLTHVGFFTKTAGTSVEIYVYDTFSGGQFTNLLGSIGATTTYGGYYAVELSSPVKLTKNDQFGIVVKFTTPGNYQSIVPMEYPIAGWSSGATANAGESYISGSGTGTSWTDVTSYGGAFAEANVCIKGIAQTPGDANGDGTVDILDVVACALMAAKFLPADIPLADMNYTRSVDVADVLLLLQRTVE